MAKPILVIRMGATRREIIVPAQQRGSEPTRIDFLPLAPPYLPVRTRKGVLFDETKTARDERERKLNELSGSVISGLRSSGWFANFDAAHSGRRSSRPKRHHRRNHSPHLHSPSHQPRTAHATHA